MARLARVVVGGLPHHVTQRGNYRQDVFLCDEDRTTYLAILKECAPPAGLHVVGYCLMTNHVHLIAVPGQPDALATALRRAHGRYAHWENARRSRTGHLWQNRFFSCVMDEPYLASAMRYVERNPVRAAIIAHPADYRWSSAQAHLTAHDPLGLLGLDYWTQRFTPPQWSALLESGDTATETEIRSRTRTGWPRNAATLCPPRRPAFGR